MTKIFGTRFSLIGDTVMSLPILTYLESTYGKYYLYFSIAKKCQQASPLFLNQPFISEIKISDFDEGLGEEDYKIIQQCDIKFNVTPPHPREQDWYNYRTCVEETALMAGLNPNDFKDSKPSLKRYWDKKPLQNTLAIWPFAGYGRGLERSPSKEWWENLLKQIPQSIEIIHFGSEIEPLLSQNQNYKKMTQLTFFEQIKMTLECSACIGTDSGSMWCVGAYKEVPQLNLLTNWLSGHNKNPLALAPIGSLAQNLFTEGGCSKIDQKLVLKFIYENICV
jgi:ADP-heptose:LPS heptosyltransferase